MDPEAFITKALTKGITSSLSKGMAKVEASFKLPALKQTPEAIKNLTKQERVLEKQILYYKLQESTIGKADRLVEKQLRQTKFMSKVLGEEKNNINIKEKQLEAIKYKKDTASGGVAEAEKGRARRFQEENMIPDQYKQGTVKNKIRGMGVSYQGMSGGLKGMFKTGAGKDKKYQEEVKAQQHMEADFKGQDTDAMWKQNQQLETKKQKTKREKGGFAKRAAVGMWKGAMGDSSIDSKHNKSVAAKRDEKKQEKLDKKKDAKSRGWLKGMFMNSEDEKKERKEGGILNFFKNHWGKILIGALLLFMPAEVFVGIWEGIKTLAAWIMGLDWKGIFTSLGNGIKGFIGLFEKGGLLDWAGFKTALAAVGVALFALMAPFTALKLFLWTIPKMFLGLAGKAFSGMKNLLGFGKKKPGGLDRKKNRSPEDQKARDKKAKDLKEQRANKDKTKTGKKSTDLAKKGGKAAGKGTKALSKLGGFLKVGVRGLAKVAGPLAIGMAVFDGVKGAMNADEMLGKKKEDLTMRDRLAGGAGGIISGLSFGLIDASSVAKFVAAEPDAKPKDTPKGKEKKKPMSKSSFLQSREYKDQVGAGTKDYVGESSGAKKMAYKEYLTKFNADEEKSNELDSLAKQAIQGPRDKVAKIKGKQRKKNKKRKIWKDFAEKIKQFPPEFQDQIKANLKPDELKLVDWKQWHEGLSDERKASLSKASKASSGISGDDDFAGGTAVMVGQGETKRNMFNKTQGENTELKSGQSSGTTIVSAPKTINQQGNAQTDNKFFGNKTAQDQRFADADIF